METITLSLRCVNLTRADLEDLRDLHKFISAMADERARNQFLNLIDEVCSVIESREPSRRGADHLNVAANEPTLSH